MSTRALLIATLIGTALQVLMVVAGHSSPSVKSLFAVLGMALSLVAGVLYAWLAPGSAWMSAALGGAAAGAICAFIGIAVSHFMGDVPVTLLALGTVSSAITGAIGGWIGTFIRH